MRHMRSAGSRRRRTGGGVESRGSRVEAERGAIEGPWSGVEVVRFRSDFSFMAQEVSSGHGQKVSRGEKW